MKYQTFPPCQDVDTSIEAAAKVLPKRGTLQWEYFEFLGFMGGYGATDHETAEHLKKPLSSICARRNELIARNPSLVRYSGKRRVSCNGGTARVWIVAENTAQFRFEL